MIHTIFLVRTPSYRTVAASRYWAIKVPRRDIIEYLHARQDLREVTSESDAVPLVVRGNKYFARDCTDRYVLIFVTDLSENDRVVNEKIEAAAQELTTAIVQHSISYVRHNFARLVAPFVHSRLKIALVGEGGVGKTTTLHLLMGRLPPRQYIPTIALDMEVVENIHFGNYSLVIWDFAGQERFRRLWKFYFKGVDIVFLLTDSTLRNVLVSKEMLTLIRRDVPNVPVVVLANKQDRPNALDPSIIERILGAETYPLIAIDITYRDRLLHVLLEAVARHIKVAVPDVSPDELFRFTDEGVEELT